MRRRHQKVIEFAPSITLDDKRRQEICEATVRLAKSVNYQNAGTVEFLVTDDKFYFIEVNPRVQVEHTVTEMITEIDIVQSQILIAAGKDLFKDLHLPQQKELKYHGCAIQCRITTEDPENNFMPDTGKDRNVSFTRWFWRAVRWWECLCWCRCDPILRFIVGKDMCAGTDF